MFTLKVASVAALVQPGWFSLARERANAATRISIRFEEKPVLLVLSVVALRGGRHSLEQRSFNFQDGLRARQEGDQQHPQPDAAPRRGGSRRRRGGRQGAQGSS